MALRVCPPASLAHFAVFAPHGLSTAANRRDGKTVENFLELGYCHVACYVQMLAQTAAPEPGGKEAKEWNGKCLSYLVDAHTALETGARKMESVGGHAMALWTDATVLEEVYLYQQLRRLDEMKAATKKEDKNEIEGFCFVNPQEEIEAICKNAGNFEKLTDQQQLKCLEEEYKQLKEFGIMDKAEEVQALHGWKAKEIHRAKASKKKKTATGPGAEFGAGGIKALTLAITQLEKACQISPNRAELWLHSGRLRAQLLLAARTTADGDEASDDGATDVAMDELRTACALAEAAVGNNGNGKICGVSPRETAVCARFYLGLLLTKKATADGGPPSTQTKIHAQARALMGPALSAWVALLHQPPPAWNSCSPLDAATPLRANNLAFVDGFLAAGESAIQGGEPAPELATKYLRTVAELSPHLLAMFCQASSTETRDGLQAAMLSAQLLLVECVITQRTAMDAPRAVLVAATLPLCDDLQASLQEAFESASIGGSALAALQKLRRRACEQRTGIDPKRCAAWQEFGTALHEEYSELAKAQRVDDSAEVKAAGLAQRRELLAQAQEHLERSLSMEGEPTLTDAEVAAGQAYLTDLKGGKKKGTAAGGSSAGGKGKAGGGKPASGGTGSRGGGRAGKSAAPVKKSAATITTTGTGSGSTKKGGATAAKAASATATSEPAKSSKSSPTSDAPPPPPPAAAAASATQELSEDAIAAGQVPNQAKSASARLQLAAILQDSLEEEEAKSGSGDEVVAKKAVMKERLVVLYNEIIELEPTNTDACKLSASERAVPGYVVVVLLLPPVTRKSPAYPTLSHDTTLRLDADLGCCELLKAEGQNVAAVQVLCKYPLANPMRQQLLPGTAEPEAEPEAKPEAEGRGYTEPPEGEAWIHGEIVTLLMRDPKQITDDLYEQLATSLTVFAKKNGMTTVEDWLEKLAEVAAFDVCKQVYCNVNDKPMDHPEMQTVFKFKGYPESGGGFDGKMGMKAGKFVS